MVVGGVVAWAEMAGRVRPVFFVAFGQYVAGLRIKAGFKSQPQAVLRARQLKLRSVGQQRLSLLETGKVKDPDPRFLHELGVLYKTDPDEIMRRFLVEKYGPSVRGDLIGHSETVERAQGGADDAAAARARELEDRLAAYEALTRKAHELATEIILITGGGPQGRETLRAAAGRRRRH